VSRWFCFHDGALDDPKVQRLPPDVFKGWINILCLASKGDAQGSPALPPLADIAFALRISEREADSLITALMTAGLLDDTPTGMVPHNWDARQHKDRTVAERMRRYRSRKADERNGHNALRVTAVTVTDEQDITEQDITVEPPTSEVVPLSDKTEVCKGPPPRKRAVSPKSKTTIPDGFPADADIRWCLDEFPKLSAWQEAERFRDRSLQHGTEWKDWTAAWRNWCRNAVRFAEERNRRFA